MTRRGLGRGLEALLAPAGEGATTTAMVPLTDIVPNPFQPRKEVSAEGLADLADSIRQHGLIQPLVVTPTAEGYQLIAGERRWRAAREAGLVNVPVVQRAADPREMLAVAVIENVQREDLDPMESAVAYRRLMDEFGLSQVEVAALIGKSRVAVANTMRLLQLPEDVQELVRRRELSEGHARALVGAADAESVRELATAAVGAGWSVRETEAAVRRSLAPEPGSDATPKEPTVERAGLDPDTAAAVKALEEALGTRVELRRQGPKGQLVVYFYSEEELGALYERIVGAL